MSDVAVLASDQCRLGDLWMACQGHETSRPGLVLSSGWAKRWTSTWRVGGCAVTAVVSDLATAPIEACKPVRRFGWRRGQRHRPGLHFVVSTGRHHGFESIAEQRLLLMLDFEQVLDVVSQPFRLRFETVPGWREHVPDFLAVTRQGVWLLDVRPLDRIGEDDRLCFAASFEAALAAGWRYAVVSGWKPHVLTTLDTLASQRRQLSDPLGLHAQLLAKAACHSALAFGDLVAATSLPAVARAYALHLLWHKHLGLDLGRPLTDRSLVWVAQ